MLTEHPLHPAMVHFPIACWSLASFADVVTLFRPDEIVWQLSGALLVVGSLTAMIAMLTGLLEFSKLKQQHPALKTANRHMLLVMISWCLYTTSLFLRLEEASIISPSLLAIGLSLIACAVLLLAGWYGGKLVYRFGVGVS